MQWAATWLRYLLYTIKCEKEEESVDKLLASSSEEDSVQRLLVSSQLAEAFSTREQEGRWVHKPWAANLKWPRRVWCSSINKPYSIHGLVSVEIVDKPAKETIASN
ncbi:hypothetical protein GOP47_0029459 [Adiantum capillus-veneris]|nr:hypothetical protein GOP47_0029459 [Adiantum capillus-veneris]